MTTQNWPQDPLVPSTTGPESSTADLSTHELGTTEFSGGTAGSDDSKKSAAKDQAKKVGQDSKDAAKNVAGTAASDAKDVAGTAATEAKNVAAEVGSQAKNLLGTVTSEVKSQAGTQQQKLTEGIRGVSDELGSMADKSDNHFVSGIVKQASQARRAPTPSTPRSGPTPTAAHPPPQASPRPPGASTWPAPTRPSSTRRTTTPPSRRAPLPWAPSRMTGACADE